MAHAYIEVSPTVLITFSKCCDYWDYDSYKHWNVQYFESSTKEKLLKIWSLTK